MSAYAISSLKQRYNKRKRRLRICIVTPDLLGPVRNGGIGTSCAYLAYELAKAGYAVSLLFTQYPTDATLSDAWIQAYRAKRIHVVIAERWNEKKGKIRVFPDHNPLYMAHIVHEWLVEQEQKTQSFDIVLFMEWQGCGFYALHSKKNRLHFQNTLFLVQIHSPTLWHSINNAEIQKYPSQAITWYIERQSVNMADAVVSPSQYMLDWCKANGYTLPGDALVLYNMLELDGISVLPMKNATKITDLVFFGRLEYRKGLVQFCNAVDILLKEGIVPRQVTFMGKFAWVGQEHAALYIARRSKNWPMPVVVIASYDHKQALKYLTHAGRLAVMPSVADNAPYTVYECLKARIPFIARHVGGIPEMVPPEAHEACLCTDNPYSLAQKIKTAFEQGIVCPGLAFDEYENRRHWRNCLERLLQKQREEKEPSSKSQSTRRMPDVSICLTHYNRPHFLKQALESLLVQDYPNFEVILADDGSTTLEAQSYLNELEPIFKARGWKILRLENGYPGRARNMAVRESKAEWLLFFDDDNVAKPHMLQTFMDSVLSSSADLGVSMFDVFSSEQSPQENTSVEERFLPLGNILSYSTFSNTIGDTTSLIRREVFLHIGGFTEDYGLGHEDFELYLKVILAGVRVTLIPEPLFWYRRYEAIGIQNSTNTAANRARSLRPFLTSVNADFAELAILTHGVVMGDITLQERATEAPSKLSERDRQLFSQRDPNAAESLLMVARALFSGGQRKLAHTLLALLHTQQNAFSVAEKKLWIQAMALDALYRHKYIHLYHYITAFERKISDERQRMEFYLSLLEFIIREKSTLRVAQAIKRNLIDKIGYIENSTIEEFLFFTLLLFDDEDNERGGFYLKKSLLKAEALYLKTRPDVYDAIKKGAFTCALHHYMLHGKADKMAWPCKNQFSELLEKYHVVIARDSRILNLEEAPYIERVFLCESLPRVPGEIFSGARWKDVGWGAPPPTPPGRGSASALRKGPAAS